MEALNNLRRLAPNMLFVSGQGLQSTASGASSTVTLKNLSGDVDTDQTQVSIVRNSIGNYSISVENAMVTGTTNAIAIACACTTGVGYLVWTNEPTASSNKLTFVVQTTTTNLADCGFAFVLVAYTPL